MGTTKKIVMGVGGIRKRGGELKKITGGTVEETRPGERRVVSFSEREAWKGGGHEALQLGPNHHPG